jgi:hypothetical protein
LLSKHPGDRVVRVPCQVDSPGQAIEQQPDVA